VNPYGERAEMYAMSSGPEQYRLFLDDLAMQHDLVNLEEFGDCTRFAPQSTCHAYADQIKATVEAFLDAYLQCDDRAGAWLESDGVTVATGGIASFVKRPAPDSDGDGGVDVLDACPGADDLVDTDFDRTPDGCDACPFDLANDGDGDGSCDSLDPCPRDPDDDADGDGACANVDPCPLDPADDADGDGVCADLDLCPLDAANDADGDGLCEDVDVCPTVWDPNQSDADVDGIGDACEPDADGDQVIDDLDDCPLVADPDQVDLDGDVCDSDDDGDGVPDGADACLATAPGAPTLPDGCSVDQECACGAPWKNHGGYVSCVSHAAGALVGAGSIDAAAAEVIVSAAARSTCGR
jgi:hypothetical protein